MTSYQNMVVLHAYSYPSLDHALNDYIIHCLNRKLFESELMRAISSENCAARLGSEIAKRTVEFCAHMSTILKKKNKSVKRLKEYMEPSMIRRCVHLLRCTHCCI